MMVIALDWTGHTSHHTKTFVLFLVSSNDYIRLQRIQSAMIILARDWFKFWVGEKKGERDVVCCLVSKLFSFVFQILALFFLSFCFCFFFDSIFIIKHNRFESLFVFLLSEKRETKENQRIRDYIFFFFVHSIYWFVCFSIFNFHSIEKS